MLDALQNAFFQTGDTLTSWLSAFSSFLWGWPLLIMLLGTHLYLTAILRFPQRYLLKALKLYFVKDHTDKGDISPFSSLMVALAANIGAGNIIGVGVAIAAGGPGAVFWCWLTGVLGMATRYSEGLLAIKYRVENKDGNMSGGPMFVLERGLNSKWLGTAFAVFTAIAAFGIGNLTQGNAAAEQLHQSPLHLPAFQALGEQAVPGPFRRRDVQTHSLTPAVLYLANAINSTMSPHDLSMTKGTIRTGRAGCSPADRRRPLLP